MRRTTQQRRVVLAHLQRTTRHPTADELFASVRNELPSISLGTVYRNLDVLCEQGHAIAIDGPTHRRYDGNTDAHYHVRCVRCGRVDDVHIPPRTALEKRAAAASSYRIVSHHVEFKGVCPECLATEAN